MPTPAPNTRPKVRAREARFLAAVWDTLAAAVSGPVPGVIHLDNAQWLDEASWVLLRYGLRRLAGRPLLIALTWRTPPTTRSAVSSRRSREAAASYAGSDGSTWTQ